MDNNKHIKYISNNNIITIITTKKLNKKSIITVEKLSVTNFRKYNVQKIFTEKNKKTNKKKKQST